MKKLINLHTGNLRATPLKQIDPSKVRLWVTREDGSLLCKEVDHQDIAPERQYAAVKDVITCTPDKSYTGIIGFGGTFTDSDVYNLRRLSESAREDAMKALFSNDGLRFNLMRVPFGSTDWNRDWIYHTYCDVPKGQTDPELKTFSIQPDIDRGLFATCREALEINPALQFLASVWGVPAWMKTNGKLEHGFFDSTWNEVYAKYLVKCIQAFAEQGIPIRYITVQNEPGTSGDRMTPAAIWTWKQQRDQVIELRKALDTAGLDTKIWIHDHNVDMLQRMVVPMLADPALKSAADAVAFHDYRGKLDELLTLAMQHPDMPLVMSEKAHNSLRGHARMAQLFRYRNTGHLNWAMVADEHGGPHQYEEGSESPKYKKDRPRMRQGSILCVPGKNPDSWFKPLAYYLRKHFSAFVQRGAMSMYCSSIRNDTAQNAVFRNPDGSIVLVAVNCGDDAIDTALQVDDAAFAFSLPEKSAVTVDVEM